MQPAAAAPQWRSATRKNRASFYGPQGDTKVRRYHPLPNTRTGYATRATSAPGLQEFLECGVPSERLEERHHLPDDRIDHPLPVRRDRAVVRGGRQRRKCRRSAGSRDRCACGLRLHAAAGFLPCSHGELPDHGAAAGCHCRVDAGASRRRPDPRQGLLARQPDPAAWVHERVARCDSLPWPARGSKGGASRRTRRSEGSSAGAYFSAGGLGKAGSFGPTTVEHGRSGPGSGPMPPPPGRFLRLASPATSLTPERVIPLRDTVARAQHPSVRDRIRPGPGVGSCRGPEHVRLVRTLPRKPA